MRCALVWRCEVGDMDWQILKSLGQIAGLAGLSFGILLIVFRDIIRKIVFKSLTQEHAYRLLRLIIILAWGIAVLGMGTWVYSNNQQARTERKPESQVESAIIAGMAVSGFVFESGSGRSVEGAQVTVVGGKANDAITDSSGTFILTFTNDVKPGDTVLIRVERSGYKPYTKMMAVSPKLPVQVFLEAIKDVSSKPPSAPPSPSADRKTPPSEVPTEMQAIIHNLSPNDLATELHNCANHLRAEWKTYWDDEDLQAWRHEQDMKHLDDSDPTKSGKVQDAHQRREDLRSVFQKNYTDTVRGCAPFAIEGANKAGGSAAMEDTATKAIIDGIVAGKIPYVNRNQDFSIYLEKLADRVIAGAR
jgi:Carboxypeptidase regulatory-like domain